MMNSEVKRALLALARKAIKSTFDGDEASLDRKLQDLQGEPYSQSCGCFVTLRDRGGQLRGCIGNLYGRGALPHTVVAMAREAAFSDPRFTALQPEELKRTVLEISLLNAPVAVAAYQQITVGQDGVILDLGGRRAVFLPHVATEQGWDRPTMLRHLCMKAGLEPTAYRDRRCRFEIFQAEVFSDGDHL